MALRAVVFDLDQTLVSAPSTDDLVDEILVRYGAAMADEELLATVVAATSDWEIVCACLPAAARQPAYDEILAANAVTAARATCLPQLRALVKRLASRYQLFIVSGRDEASIAQILRGQGWTNSFREVVAASPGSPVKPDPRLLTEVLGRHGLVPAEAVYVGDRPEDLELARRAGTAFLAAGFYVDRLVGCPATIVRSARELLAAIDLIARGQRATSAAASA